MSACRTAVKFREEISGSFERYIRKKSLLWGAVSSLEAGEDLVSVSVDVLCTL